METSTPESVQVSDELRTRILTLRVHFARALTGLQRQAVKMRSGLDVQPSALTELRRSVQALAQFVTAQFALEQVVVAGASGSSLSDGSCERRMHSEHAAQRRVLHAFSATIEQVDRTEIITVVTEQLIETLRGQLDRVDHLLAPA